MRRGRRDAWLAAALRRAYDMDWVPPSVVANIHRVDVDTVHRRVILVLRTGTLIVDRHTRIDVVGKPDDVTIAEMVAAVRRRGWDAVQLHGSSQFRREAAFRLQLLEPPVVVFESPLTDADQDHIERLRRRRAAMPEVWHTPAARTPPSPPIESISGAP